MSESKEKNWQEEYEFLKVSYESLKQSRDSLQERVWLLTTEVSGLQSRLSELQVERERERANGRRFMQWLDSLREAT